MFIREKFQSCIKRTDRALREIAERPKDPEPRKDLREAIEDGCELSPGDGGLVFKLLQKGNDK